MDVDFSRFNVEYFLSLRELANENPAVAASIFRSPPEFLRGFAKLTPHQLANLANVNIPLVVPQDEPTWWPRFIRALRDGDHSEVMSLSEEASFYFIQPGRARPC